MSIYKTQYDASKPMTLKEFSARGGRTTKEKHGDAHFKQIGSKGGSVTKKKYGKDHYKELNRLSVLARRKKKKDISARLAFLSL